MRVALRQAAIPDGAEVRRGREQAFAEEESDCELEVLTRRAHGHGDRLSWPDGPADPDLERLFADDEVGSLDAAARGQRGHHDLLDRRGPAGRVRRTRHGRRSLTSLTVPAA